MSEQTVRTNKNAGKQNLKRAWITAYKRDLKIYCKSHFSIEEAFVVIFDVFMNGKVISLKRN